MRKIQFTNNPAPQGVRYSSALDSHAVSLPNPEIGAAVCAISAQNRVPGVKLRRRNVCFLSLVLADLDVCHRRIF